MHHVPKPQRNHSLLLRALLVVGALTVVAIAGFGVVALLDDRESAIFHVSAAGDDDADGRTPQTAWRTLARASSADFTPGDKLLLEGGSTFEGQLLIDHGAGDAANPVVVGSFGEGRATIRNLRNSAIAVTNTGGVTVQDLDIVGPGAQAAQFDGVAVFNDRRWAPRNEGIVIQRVSVTGYKHGIAIGAQSGATGFDGVDVRDSIVRDNRLSGLFTYGPNFDAEQPTYAHTRVRVSRVEAAGSTGDPTLRQNSGSGIVLGSVDGGIIERSTAHHNGALSDTIEGPAGIWTYDSTRVRIEHNLAFANTTSQADGHGFDLDQNVSNSALEYNLSYDNAGAGYMLFSNAANRHHTNNRVRFNVSVNDARFSGFYGAITIFGGTHGPDSSTGVFDAQIYHNTVISAASRQAIPPIVLALGTLGNVHVLNNIFVANSGAQLIRAKEIAPSSITFRGNAYFADETARPFEWDDIRYPTLDDWRDATDQEMLRGNPVGIEADPELRGLAGSPTSIRNASQIHEVDLRLSVESPLVNKGVDLAALRIDRGREDYFADKLTASYDVGAATF